MRDLHPRRQGALHNLPKSREHRSHPMPTLRVRFGRVHGRSAPLTRSRATRLTRLPQTHRYEVVLVDLLLLRSKVFRHLLRNRGTGTDDEREAERTRSMLRLGAVVIFLDACESLTLVERVGLGSVPTCWALARRQTFGRPLPLWTSWTASSPLSSSPRPHCTVC